MKYEELPEGICSKSIDLQVSQRLYGYLSKTLIDDLSGFLSNKRVLEVYAGRGHLSSLLAERGVEIKSTSLRQGHDFSADLGHVFNVEDLDVISAVVKYHDWLDVLLVCWPTTDLGLFKSLKWLTKDTPIVFIGEVTDYSRKPFPFLGGCATDEFFDAVVEMKEATRLIRYPTHRCDQLKIYKKK
ncbi:hypothetical protein P5704_024340 (plasmid) [Pseudomonas sp. FeN3W]|nr:hypothetical protein P5704_024340 [Pseudomonas sp. FeN3W]